MLSGRRSIHQFGRALKSNAPHWWIRKNVLTTQVSRIRRGEHMPSWAVWQAPDSSGVSQPGAPNKSMLHSHVQTRTSPPLQANSGPKFSGNISVSFSQIVGVTRIQEAPRKKAVIRRAVREQSRGSASTAERKACNARAAEGGVDIDFPSTCTWRRADPVRKLGTRKLNQIWPHPRIWTSRVVQGHKPQIGESRHERPCVLVPSTLPFELLCAK